MRDNSCEMKLLPQKLVQANTPKGQSHIRLKAQFTKEGAITHSLESPIYQGSQIRARIIERSRCRDVERSVVVQSHDVTMAFAQQHKEREH